VDVLVAWHRILHVETSRLLSHRTVVFTKLGRGAASFIFSHTITPLAIHAKTNQVGLGYRRYSGLRRLDDIHPELDVAWGTWEIADRTGRSTSIPGVSGTKPVKAGGPLSTWSGILPAVPSAPLSQLSSTAADGGGGGGGSGTRDGTGLAAAVIHSSTISGIARSPGSASSWNVAAPTPHNHASHPILGCKDMGNGNMVSESLGGPCRTLLPRASCVKDTVVVVLATFGRLACNVNCKRGCRAAAHTSHTSGGASTVWNTMREVVLVS